MSRIPLNVIVFDAGTQIRQSINEDVVSEYAERMTEGVEFPPVVLFHDGNQYYMADGFHRALAARRNDFCDIEAAVTAGTKTDALWFALGANKSNGQRLTVNDKKHAILLALQAFPARSAGAIAEQIGVNQDYVSELRRKVKDTLDLPERVTGKDGKSYPASRASNLPVSHKLPIEKAEAIERMLRDGSGVNTVAKALSTTTRTVHKVREAIGLPGIDRTPSGVSARRDRIRQMAEEGYTSRQIAEAIGQSHDGTRDWLRKEGVDVPGDRATRHTKRHDSTRIVETIVMDAEHLTAGVNLIDFSTLDRGRIGEWAESLIASKKALDSFIRRLLKEQQKHGEAA